MRIGRAAAVYSGVVGLLGEELPPLGGEVRPLGGGVGPLGVGGEEDPRFVLLGAAAPSLNLFLAQHIFFFFKSLLMLLFSG